MLSLTATFAAGYRWRRGHSELECQGRDHRIPVSGAASSQAALPSAETPGYSGPAGLGQITMRRVISSHMLAKPIGSELEVFATNKLGLYRCS